jgi:hypothetical protein
VCTQCSLHSPELRPGASLRGRFLTQVPRQSPLYQPCSFAPRLTFAVDDSAIFLSAKLTLGFRFSAHAGSQDDLGDPKA